VRQFDPNISIIAGCHETCFSDGSPSIICPLQRAAPCASAAVSDLYGTWASMNLIRLGGVRRAAFLIFPARFKTKAVLSRRVPPRVKDRRRQQGAWSTQRRDDRHPLPHSERALGGRNIGNGWQAAIRSGSLNDASAPGAVIRRRAPNS
jgi:hypothetical protein